MAEEQYYFYLWVEWIRLYDKWVRWWEDLIDLLWFKNKED